MSSYGLSKKKIQRMKEPRFVDVARYNVDDIASLPYHLNAKEMERPDICLPIEPDRAFDSLRSSVFHIFAKKLD